MRVLIAARFTPDGPRPIGGVQSWSATVGAELRQRGHDVVFWGPGSSLAGMFDIGIAANIGDTRPALRLCTQHVVMCHGIIAPEKPAARAVAFTSEEVRDYWQGDGPIIRQPIDLDFWRPQPTEKHLLVRFSYRRGLEFVPALAQSLGLGFAHVENDNPQQVRETLSQAVCVLATGRSALEAMACGVPVVICDDRVYQAPLLDMDTTGSMLRNYSGRGGVTPNEQNVRPAIEAAIAHGSLRSHVEEHHDVRNIVTQLLCCIS
jgi:hypothetical protein